MKNCWFILAIAVVVTSCKAKEKGAEKKFISVRSLIEKQVAHIDTSLYAITKVVTKDSLHSDTFYISRENFRAEAKDFLEIPDLSVQKIAKRYNEETRYDELLNRVIITYTPQKPEKEEIQKQEILVTPNIATGDKVNNIIIESVKSDRNGFFEKKMLWQVDHSFLITTTTQKPGESEIVTTTRVTWNDHSQQ
ncbi:hypothetical protein CAP36_06340 [Chitinophagaceae bacterium IBVUCB2]|nr:hypothetical protein CAP36_06340 [Chitinophagaceae bacterium IBVUCB2]